MDSDKVSFSGNGIKYLLAIGPTGRYPLIIKPGAFNSSSAQAIERIGKKGIENNY